MSLELQGIHIRFQGKGDFLQPLLGVLFLQVTVFLLAVLEKQDYGVCVLIKKVDLLI